MNDPCFTLRLHAGTGQPLIIIRAYDNMSPSWDSAGRIRLTCEVRHGGQVIFPYGQLSCALHGTSDGFKARELVLALVGMAPQDRSGVGEDYFADYSEEQRDWADANYEELGMVRDARYCDPETGSVKRTA